MKKTTTICRINLRVLIDNFEHKNSTFVIATFVSSSLNSFEIMLE